MNRRTFVSLASAAVGVLALPALAKTAEEGWSNTLPTVKPEQGERVVYLRKIDDSLRAQDERTSWKWQRIAFEGLKEGDHFILIDWGENPTEDGQHLYLATSNPYICGTSKGMMGLNPGKYAAFVGIQPVAIWKRQGWVRLPPPRPSLRLQNKST